MDTGTQLSIDGIPGGDIAWPRAARLQKAVTTADGILTSLARRNGHNVLWWWGIRRKPQRMCAFCYVCDQVITLGALNANITPEQSQAIDEHRNSHWQEVTRERKATEAATRGTGDPGW